MFLDYTELPHEISCSYTKHIFYVFHLAHGSIGQPRLNAKNLCQKSGKSLFSGKKKWPTFSERGLILIRHQIIQNEVSSLLIMNVLP